MTTRKNLAKALLWEVSLAIVLGSAPGSAIAAKGMFSPLGEGVRLTPTLTGVAQAVTTPTPPPPPKPKVQTTPEASPTPRATTAPARGASGNTTAAPTATPTPTPTASPSPAAVVSPTPTPTPAATTAPVPTPMSQPAAAASEVMPTSAEEERIQKIVQAEVDRLFSKTTNLLNWVLGLTLFLVAGTWVGIWLMRRSVAEQVGTEVKKQLGGELNPQTTSAIVPHSAPPQPSDNTALPVLSSQQKAEQNAQLNELISMALATQNLIAEARSALEESAKFQDNIQKPFQDVLGVYLTQAQELVAQGKYQEAVEIYDRSISINPDFYDAWLERGKALSKLRRHDEAIASYNKAIQINSSRCDSWYEKACCYALKGDADLVIDNLRQAINIDPSKKEKAKFDATFTEMRADEAFAQLIFA